MIDAFLSALLQLLLFTLIPFLVWLVRRRKHPGTGFREYIGLLPSNRKANGLAVLYSLALGAPLVLIVVLTPELYKIMTDPQSTAGSFRGMEFGIPAVVQLVLAAGIKTALSEEIFFRGFLAKRLIARLGYRNGNLLQAVLFGLLHSLLFLLVSDNILFLFVIFLFPAVGAYLMAYLNEKRADGSILPGWIMHATSNLISYSLFGFLL